MSASISKANLLLLIVIFIGGSLRGQVCDNKYLSLIYKGQSYDTFTRTIFSKGEILSIGQLSDATGHIVKYSGNGTPIWSYQYSLDFYSFYPPTFFKTIRFTDLLATSDGGYLVSGNVDQVLSPYGLPPPVKKYALLAKIDKYGKVLWNKTLSNAGDLSFSNIFETSDGDCIAYLATDNGKKKLPGDHTYGKILRVDSKGAIKWSTLLFTFLFDAGGLGLDFKRTIMQSANKNIIIGQAVHKTELANMRYRIFQGNLHFLELDYASGKINWETSYEYPVPFSDSLYTPDIVHADVLPDGRFSFITTLYLSTANHPALTKKGAVIITSNKGKIEDIIAYSPANGTPSEINEVSVDIKNGTKTLLFINKDNAALTNITNDGKINWTRGYDNGAGRFPVNCFSSREKGYNIFTGNNASAYSRLLITDSTGGVDCANVDADMIAEQAIFSYPHDSVATDAGMRFDDYQDNAYPLKRNEAYPIDKTIDCQQTISCCTDFIDSVHFKSINICEGKNFMLPDGTIVQDSGTYYVTFKTTGGCDSTRFYKVSVDKGLSGLSLGNDTCLTQSNSIILKATKGYDKYYWGNDIVATGEVYAINHPGNFYVTVLNSCGSKTDSITIYDQCDYPIYMPGAFTPNNDNLNDYYRVSRLNKNHLISFKIYNRWGQLLFQTNKEQEGWDGRLHNEPLPSDTFIYYVEMKGISGKLISEKGTFLLIR